MKAVSLAQVVIRLLIVYVLMLVVNLSLWCCPVSVSGMRWRLLGMACEGGVLFRMVIWVEHFDLLASVVLEELGTGLF